MTHEEKILAENYLAVAISSLLDIEDTRERNKKIKANFYGYCSENNIRPEEAIEIVDHFIESRSEYYPEKGKRYKKARARIVNEGKDKKGKKLDTTGSDGIEL